MTEATKKEGIVKVLLDASPQVEEQRKIIDNLHEEIGKRDELLKSYMKKDVEEERLKAIRVNDPAPAPISDPQDTAPLFEPTHEPKFDIDNSQVLDILSFHSEQEAIDFLKDRASNPQCGDYELAKKLYGKAVKRTLREGGSFQFEGNMCRYERQGDKIVKASRPKTFRKIEDE